MYLRNQGMTAGMTRHSDIEATNESTIRAPADARARIAISRFCQRERGTLVTSVTPMNPLNLQTQDGAVKWGIRQGTGHEKRVSRSTLCL